MTTDITTAVIHQAFFGYDGSEGLTMLAGSFDLHSPEAELRREQLLPHLRLTGYDSAVPSSALSYLMLTGGTAAVVRRVDRGESAGRNNSHVLLGPSSALTPDLALTLGGWAGWEGTPPAGREMAALGLPELRHAGTTADQLFQRSLDRRDLLEKVLAWQVQTSGRALSIIDCPHDNRLGLLWGLLCIADAAGLDRSEWTFSTYEVEHADSIRYLPRIIFLPDWPSTGGAANRVLVDLRREITAGPHAVARARELIDLHANGMLSTAEADHPAVPSDLDEPTVIVDQPTQVHSQYGAPIASPTRPPGIPPYAPPMYVDPSGPPPPEPRQPFRSNQSVNLWRDDELIDRLRRSPDSLLSVLGYLEARQYRTQPERAELRLLLGKIGWAIEETDTRVAPAERGDVRKRLLQLGFGKQLQDFASPEGADYAVLLIEKCPSEELVKELGLLARQHQVLKDNLKWLLLNRYLRTAPPAAQETPAGAGFVSQITRSLQVRGVVLAVVGVLIVALLVLMFVLGRMSVGILT